jgi:hypothetical protein
MKLNTNQNQGENFMNKVTLTSEFRVQTQHGQFIKGQFLIENLSPRAVNVSKFIADINYEMVYFDVEGNTFFRSEGEFHTFLNANANNEVLGKAEAQSGFNCTGKLTLG